MNISFTCDDIVKICHAKCLCLSETSVIEKICIDSRHIPTPENTIFIAIAGDKHDGHRFIEETYRKGVRNFLVSEEKYVSMLKDANVFLVDNTLKAFQQLAAAHRCKFDIPIVAITGSNGKTIVKEWLCQLLSPEHLVAHNPGSFNSQVGVPLSIFTLAKEHTIGVFEAGISMPGEMENLESIIKPEIGIFTNIGSAHNENFINNSQKAAEKLNLFVHCKSLIYCSDHYDIKERLYSSGLALKINMFSWGTGPDNKLIVKNINYCNRYSVICFKYEGNEYDCEIPFVDAGSVENAIHCLSFMLLRGYDALTAISRLKSLQAVEMRLETKDAINDCVLINDSYNSDLNSLSIALDFLEKNKRYSRKTLILSDILQSGKNQRELAVELSEMLAQRNIFRFIGIGKILCENKDLFTDNASFFFTTDEFIKTFDLASFEKEIILLKGARKFEFEQISRLLEAKVHNTTLEIDLNALTYNLNYFRHNLSDNQKLMVMVKAFAYGGGAYEIANHLQYHRVDYMTVAVIDEGIELRKVGINTPIMVMNSEKDHLPLLLKYNLEPEVYSFALLDKLIESIEEWKGYVSLPVSIHLKFDTGMHRLGFSKSDIPKLLSVLKENEKYVKVVSVFSHLSSADDPSKDDFTRSQISLFSMICNELEINLDYPFLRHIANSTAILRFPDAHFDMVRLGIGLYGIIEAEHHDENLMNVASFKTHISQIRIVPANEGIGYSCKAKSDKERKVATLSVGYADGFRRSMGNENWNVLVRNQKAPVLGNICMDMCMIDVTNIQGVAEGDEVVLFGKNLPLNDYAKAMNTIPYEALTSISNRVKRIYVSKNF